MPARPTQQRLAARARHHRIMIGTGYRKNVQSKTYPEGRPGEETPLKSQIVRREAAEHLPGRWRRPLACLDIRQRGRLDGGVTHHLGHHDDGEGDGKSLGARAAAQGVALVLPTQRRRQRQQLQQVAQPRVGHAVRQPESAGGRRKRRVCKWYCLETAAVRVVLSDDEAKKVGDAVGLARLHVERHGEREALAARPQGQLQVDCLQLHAVRRDRHLTVAHADRRALAVKEHVAQHEPRTLQA